MKKILSVVLSILLVFSCASVASAAGEKSADIGVISDIHYIPREYIGSVAGFNYRREVDNDRKLEQYSEEILDAAIDKVLENGDKYLFVSGDIALSSHYASHMIVASKLKAVEAQGVKVYVIPGNHDIVRADKAAYRYVADDVNDTITKAGTVYVNDTKQETKSTNKYEFAELYADFGYGKTDEVIARDTDTLSYVAQLDGYRLIAVDANYYENGFYTNKKGLDEQRLNWVLEQVAACKSAGDIPLVMMHYDLIEKYDSQSLILGANFLDNSEDIATALADAGVQYIFTGHSHANDIASLTTDSINTLYEICTGGLLLHGSPVRDVKLSGSDADIKTDWLTSIDGIADYQSFCDDYYYTDGIRIALRNRVIFDVSDILTDTFCKSDSMRAQFSNAFTDLMQGVCDRLLDLKLTDSITVCDVLTESYHQHYKGDEVYSDEMKAAVAELKSGYAWTQALLIVEEELGKATTLSDLLAKTSGAYNNGTLEDVARIINTSLSPILGPLMGTFVENTFIDKAPADNNLKIVGGEALDAGSGEQSADFTGKLMLFFINIANLLKLIFTIVK